MYRNTFTAGMLIATVLVCLTGSMVSGKSLKAPLGLFRDLNDEIVADAIIINGKQLFIDDYIIEELKGTKKVLNQPVKHPKNPLVVPDKPWEGKVITNSVIYDKEEGIYKMWYTPHSGEWVGGYCPTHWVGYATSKDGINWRKPLITPWKGNTKSNIVFSGKPALNCAGVFKDPAETDPKRRYKMLYSYYPDGTAKTASTNAAYSPDGIHWTEEPENPLIPFSDVQPCAFWDASRGRYVAYLRYGPPNTRIISRIESEDFVHWSPKVSLFSLNNPLEWAFFQASHYAMPVLPYEGVYIGFLPVYQGETIKPIPEEDKAWRDKVRVQLTFSRDGLTWLRIGKYGPIPTTKLYTGIDLTTDKEWKTRLRPHWRKVCDEATFLPYGEHGKDWDWGMILLWDAPLVVGDEIWIYYVGARGRHFAWSRTPFHKDKIKKKGIGLATLRLDGFVSIDAVAAGTMTTKKFVFIGDTLEINANAKGGSIIVEALDADGKVIEGFSKEDCTAITTDSVRHMLKWKGKKDCHLIQARPISLRFHLKKAKLYSFTPRIRHKHYVQSYD